MEIENNKLGFIDASRGIAIILVVMVHTSQSLNLPINIKNIFGIGAYGVQLFFIASAYTMCMSLERLMKSSNNYLFDFGIKRFFRIAPLYYLGIIIYFTIGVAKSYIKYGSFDIPFEYSFKNIIANIFFYHGFYPPANNNVVPGGWSIGTEMSFYLIFPFLFLAFKLFNSNIKQIVFLFIILVISFLFNLFCIDKFNDYPLFVYFNLFSQLPVFIVGMILWQKGFIKLNNKYLSIFIVFIFLILLFLLLSESILLSSSLLFLKPFISSIMFSLLLIILQNISTPKIIQTIGKNSYSVYIFHFIFAWFILREINKIIPVFIFDSFLLSIGLYFVFVAGILFFSVLLGKLTHLLLEQPFINLGNKIIKSNRRK